VTLLVPPRIVRSSTPGATGPAPTARSSLFTRPASHLDRRSLHPIDRLSRELDDVCTTAVDDDEIAAILEAEGINDDVSRALYNCPDVFALAAELWDRTPHVVEQVPTSIEVDRPGSLRDLVHGLLFALNGLFFSVGLQVATSRSTTAALVIALVAGWAVGQAASLLWFRLEARKGDVAGRTVLRRSLEVVLVAGLGCGWLCERLGLPPAVTLLAVGQVYFVIAVSALLLYRKELWFFLTLLPGIVVVLVSYAGRSRFDTRVGLAAVVFTIVAVVVEAAWLVRPRGPGPQRTSIEWLDVGHALQMSLYGMIGALLLSYRAVSSLVADVQHDVQGFDVSVLPLVLTIGVAEWQLRSYRQLSRQVLGLTDDLARFGAVAWRFLLRSFARYWAVLGVASVALWAVVRLSEGVVPAETTLLSTTYAVLGAALFLNLVLIAHARVDIALRSFIVTGTAYVVLLAVQTAERFSPSVLAALFLALCVGLLCFLLLATRRVVRQPLVHL
jgi:hypothetical protein